MKKTFLFLLISLFAVAVFAQTGMFDLSYGQNIDDAHKALLTKGFTVAEKTETTTEYSNTKIPHLLSLKISYNKEDQEIIDWIIKYQVNGDQELIDKYIADLDELQDVTSYYDDYTEEYVWELDNYNAIYMSLSEERAIMTIDYTEYDDYYYYDDYWY